MSGTPNLVPNDEKIAADIGGLEWEWDLARGSLRHCGMPAVALWIDHSIGRMLHPLRDEIGPALSDLLIASSGLKGAHKDYQAIVAQHRSTFVEGFAGWANAVASAGWGIFSLVNYDEKEHVATVRVDRPWELELAVGLPATCPFIQGKLIGLFTLAFGTGCWADPVGGSTGGNDDDRGFVEFMVTPSSKTIADEIEHLRHARMQQAELALTHEVNLQTLALRAAEESQRSILNSLGDLVVTLNADGVIEQYILPTLDHAGFPSAELALGRPIDQVFGEPFSHLNNRLTRYPERQLSVSCEHRIGEEQRCFDTRVSVRKDVQDAAEGLTLVIRDVTVQRQL